MSEGVGKLSLPVSHFKFIISIVDALVSTSVPPRGCCTTSSRRHGQKLRNCFPPTPGFFISHPEVTRVTFLELLQLKIGEIGESLFNAVLQKCRFLWLMSPHSAT